MEQVEVEIPLPPSGVDCPDPVHAAQGEPAQVIGEDEQEDHAGDEQRGGPGRRAKDDQPTLQGPLAADDGEHAQGDAEQVGPEHGQEHEDNGVPEPGQDHLAYRDVAVKGDAEVQPGEVLDVTPELEEQGLVQAPEPLELVLDLRAHAAGEDRGGRVAGHEAKEEELDSQKGDGGEEHHPGAGEEESGGHGLAPLFMYLGERSAGANLRGDRPRPVGRKTGATWGSRAGPAHPRCSPPVSGFLGPYPGHRVWPGQKPAGCARPCSPAEWARPPSGRCRGRPGP